MNQFYARNAAVGLCLYSLRAFPPEPGATKLGRLTPSNVQLCS